MFVQVNVISGVMLGIEFLWCQGIMVVDIGIIRIYLGIIPKEEQND